MAQVFPDFENIHRLKVKPTPGELHLLNLLATNLSDDHEVYFQPLLNGDMPDIIILKKGHGATIVEVKDWNLGAYTIDENNCWHERRGGHQIRSPFQQVFGYKKNLFDIHINGMTEKALLDNRFYGAIKVFVYFSNADWTDIQATFHTAETHIHESKKLLNLEYKEGNIAYTAYENRRSYLQKKGEQISRDKDMSLHPGELKRLLRSLKNAHELFDDAVFNEFRRYLQPPIHVATQGIAIPYTAIQEKLSISTTGFQKIRGVAGSGKTTVLAKRAVNAHKRHGGQILILTFNITLRNHIHDRISEIRENFNWGFVQISTYHAFVSQSMNTCGILWHWIENRRDRKNYFDSLYADENLFDGYETEVRKYQTILIDEVQDYQPEWLKIIRKYFLEEDGEMVLFADDSQNIYHRDINKRDAATVRGFGEWQKLKISHRAKNGSSLTRLARNFQETFLSGKHVDDLIELEPSQEALSFEVLRGHVLSQSTHLANAQQILDLTTKLMRETGDHPNDLCVVSADVDILRKLDQLIKTQRNEETQTTFETQEFVESCTRRVKPNSDEFKDIIEKIRKAKKLSFWMNSGLTKLATLHSFKGMEAVTVVLILTGDEEDELVYTGITRAKKNLLILLPRESRHFAFFNKQMTILDQIQILQESNRPEQIENRSSGPEII